MKRSATIDDVAKAAGVARVTVSRVLNNGTNVRPETRERVRRAVEALGYSAAMVGGGVACNRALVARLRERLAGRARVSVASPRLNTDNAAMIAAAGAWRLSRGERSSWDLEPRDDLPLPGLVAASSLSGRTK